MEGKDFAQIDFIKRNILDLYEEDLAKYDQQNHDKASVVFRTIPEQLENKNSHFKLSLLGKNARYRNYVEAVSFIADSMIGNECINVTKPEPALELFADRSNFKLYMGDTGLLVTQIMRSDAETGDALYKALITGRLGINEGMVMENMVAQMLRAAGHGLYFHEYRYCPEGSQRENSYEIDFLIVRNKKLCPLEVKSSGYQTHKSFDYLVEKVPIENGRTVHPLYPGSADERRNRIPSLVYGYVSLTASYPTSIQPLHNRRCPGAKGVQGRRTAWIPYPACPL